MISTAPADEDSTTEASEQEAPVLSKNSEQEAPVPTEEHNNEGGDRSVQFDYLNKNVPCFSA